jgi:hypothetical protein
LVNKGHGLGFEQDLAGPIGLLRGHGRGERSLATREQKWGKEEDQPTWVSQ